MIGFSHDLFFLIFSTSRRTQWTQNNSNIIYSYKHKIGFRTYDYVTPKFRIVGKTTAAELLTIAVNFQMRHDYTHICSLISTFISYTLLYTMVCDFFNTGCTYGEVEHSACLKIKSIRKHSEQTTDSADVFTWFDEYFPLLLLIDHKQCIILWTELIEYSLIYHCCTVFIFCVKYSFNGETVFVIRQNIAYCLNIECTFQIFQKGVMEYIFIIV
jgi:hypothetical protein